MGPKRSLFAGHERHRHLCHGEDRTASAFSTSLYDGFDIADGDDSCDAHVGILVSKRGGVAIHNSSATCMRFVLCTVAHIAGGILSKHVHQSKMLAPKSQTSPRSLY